MLNIHPSTSSTSITSDDEEKQNDKGRKQNENTKVSPTKINERFESNTIFRAQAVLRNDNTMRKENVGRQIVAFDKSGQYLAAMKVEDNDSTTINFWYIKKKKCFYMFKINDIND
jgi:hypothetical protein